MLLPACIHRLIGCGEKVGLEMSKLRGFAGWKPYRKSAVILEEVQRILAEDFASILPVTVRQIFYRLVSSGHLGKNDDDIEALDENALRCLPVTILG